MANEPDKFDPNWRATFDHELAAFLDRLMADPQEDGGWPIN